MDDSTPTYDDVYRKLSVLSQRWLPMLLSRAGVPRQQTVQLRDEGGGLEQQLALAAELIGPILQNSTRERHSGLDVPQALAQIIGRMQGLLELEGRDLHGAKAGVLAVQRDLLGLVVGVEIAPPRPRSVTPSWAKYLLPTAIMRI